MASVVGDCPALKKIHKFSGVKSYAPCSSCYIRPLYEKNYKTTTIHTNNYFIPSFFGLDNNREESIYLKMCFLLKNGYKNEIYNLFGIMDVTPLLLIPNINIVSLSPYEGMHSLVIGVISKFMRKIKRYYILLNIFVIFFYLENSIVLKIKMVYFLKRI